MASLTLYQKKARGQSSGWGSWGTVSGVDYCSLSNRAYVVYSASLDLSGSSSLTGCQVSTNFVCRSSSASHQATVHCYVYTSDPTSSSPTSVPSGYIAHAQYTITVPYYGVYQTFYFTGLNVTNGSRLYFFFTNDNSSAYADDIYNYATGNGYTGTPTCSGSFSAAKLSLSLSASSVSTGNNQVATIGNGSGRSVTVRVYYGNTQLYAASTSTGSLTIQVTKSWFTTAGLTSVTSMSVSVRIDEDSSLYESFTVTAGADMTPTVTNITTAIVQTGNAATYFPDTYLANISKCKVSATVTSRSNATISTVKLTYPGGATVTLTYNSSTGKYEGTTAALTASVSFTVTATDSRSLTGSGTSSEVTVVQYSKPAINISSARTYRCNSAGTQESGGAYWRAQATATYYTSLSGNSLLQFNVRIKGGTAVNLSSGVQTSAQGGSLNRTTNYTLVFTIQDKVSDAITKEFTLESVTRNVVMRRNSTGTSVGVGITPQRASGSAVELPQAGDYLINGIPAQAFYTPYSSALDGSSFGKDFLNVNRDNSRAVENAAAFFYRPLASMSEWSNAPATNDSYNWRGYRMVLWYSTYFQMVIVFEFYPYPGRIWSNFYNNNLGWTGWRYTSAVTPSS